ncbi:hypothetical protein WG66_011206 [Moniliophthora roreri]|nr:hypothetical protein WG66_011206 [Moniliophthora roreri]
MTRVRETGRHRPRGPLEAEMCVSSRVGDEGQKKKVTPRDTPHKTKYGVRFGQHDEYRDLGALTKTYMARSSSKRG